MRPSTAQRETFRQAAGLLLPAWRHMPGADTLGIEAAQLDQALEARPEAAAALARILDGLATPVDRRAVAALEKAAPADFALLRATP